MIILEYIINLYLWIKIHFLCYINYNFNKTSKKLSNNYELTFIDNFDNKVLDTTKWQTNFWWGLPIHPGNIENENKAPYVIYNETNHFIEKSKIYLFTQKVKQKYHYIDYNGKDWGIFTIPYSINKNHLNNNMDILKHL